MKSYKDIIGTTFGSRPVKDTNYGFVLCKVGNKTITAICDIDKLPARGEEIAITETTENGKKQYRVW